MINTYITDAQYEVTIVTGDEKGAGCSGQVFMKVYGSKGATPEMKIDKTEQRFERGRSDLIKVIYIMFYISKSYRKNFELVDVNDKRNKIRSRIYKINLEINYADVISYM